MPISCSVCQDFINDKYIYKIDDKICHQSCLKCSHCDSELDNEITCYVKENQLYCKLDYMKYFSSKCAKCFQGLQANDWVRRAKNYIYHLACFVCDICKRQLSTGEEFIMWEDQVICKNHYSEPEDDLETYEDSSDSETRHLSHKSKRVRTTFTEEQIRILQANFMIDCNPDGGDLERISQFTGLSKRVVQVWFQNSRARQKKYIKPLDTYMGYPCLYPQYYRLSNFEPNSSDTYASNIIEYKCKKTDDVLSNSDHCENSCHTPDSDIQENVISP
ncbi:unnamed protein product [Gordionus sp. m RMFG-2023]|uniref:LIM/homeobox protein Awh-like n=1 Tax=Gordionus sp. m RMFG-2023 TaxID=3053472 RepID=UPI0030E2B4B6